MIAVMVLLGTIALSSIIGLYLFRRPRTRRFSFARFLLSALIASVVAITTLIVFIVMRFSYPAADDANLRSETHLTFHSAVAGRDSTILIAYQSNTTIDHDYQIVVRVEGAGPEPQLYRLETARSIELRTVDRCADSNTNTIQNVACTSQDNPKEVRWEATPKSTGSVLSTLVLPVAVRPGHLLGADWTAQAFVNDRVVSKGGAYDRGYGPYESYGLYGDEGPYTMNADAPAMSYENWSIDLASGQIRFTTDVVRTLGVSDRTYVTLAVVGTFASGALGSGWLFKLFGLLSSYRKRGQPEGGIDSEDNRAV